MSFDRSLGLLGWTRTGSVALGIALLSVTSVVGGEVPGGGEAAPKAPLRFGMSTALSGPAGDLGTHMRAGVQAAFDEVNRAGGVNGRALELVALDDGYEPSRAGPNRVRLIDDEHVLGVIGNVGTPTAVAAIPIALEKKTLFYGAFTGAGTLRKTPPDRYVINYRASSAQETAAMVDAMVDQAGLAPAEIAFFTQRDAFGDAGFSGGIAALKRHGLEDETLVAHGRYERNTVAVETALADLLTAETRPRAVIMVGTYAPCAAFVKLARANGLDAKYLNVSFVGTQSLITTLGAEAEGVIVTQVVPSLEAEVPIVKAYRAALAADATPNFGSLEGYIAARILCLALAKTGREPTRESIVESLEALGSFDAGLGSPLLLSREKHQACDQVWPTIVRGGKAIALDWRELGVKSGPPAVRSGK